MAYEILVEREDGWYFYDETGDIGGGPYVNLHMASANQILYCLTHLGNYPPEKEKELIDEYLKEFNKGMAQILRKAIEEVWGDK